MVNGMQAKVKLSARGITFSSSSLEGPDPN